MVSTVVSAFLGSACGISTSYILGRIGGFFLIRRYGRKVHITPEKIERVHRWMGHSGRWSLTFGYFIPGVRHLTALVAGASGLKYSVFAVFAYSGALFWSLTFISAGYFLEMQWLRQSAAIQKIILILFGSFVLISILSYLVFRKIRKNR